MNNRATDQNELYSSGITESVHSLILMTRSFELIQNESTQLY